MRRAFAGVRGRPCKPDGADGLTSIAAPQVAGALHSVYGTRKFRRVTVVPTPERRAEIAAAFGARAEHLAYLFHATDRPRWIHPDSTICPALQPNSHRKPKPHLISGPT